MFFLQGLIFDDPQPPPGIRTVQLNKDEIDGMIKNMMHKPVLLNHQGHSIGKVLDVHVSIDGDVLVDLFVDVNTPRGQQAKEYVESGVFTGLSFGSSALIDMTTGIRHSKYTPIEVSIVPDGGVNRSRIVFWGNSVRDLRSSVSGFHDVFTKSIRRMEPMSAETVELTPQQLEEAKKVFGVLRELGVSSSNLAEFGSLAKSVLKKKQEEFTTLVAGASGKMGLVEYAKAHLDPDEMDEFKNYLSQQASTFSHPPIMMKVSASLLSNYQDLMVKGAAEQKKLQEEKSKKQIEETRRVPSVAADWVGQTTALVDSVFNTHHPKRMRTEEEKPSTSLTVEMAKERLSNTKPTITQVE
jgi:hypothetical protein